MKFITVLLAVLAVFSPVVHSQKVDPLASSVVETAKEEDVSPMKNLDGESTQNSDALSTFSEATHIDQTTTHSIVDEKQLNHAATPRCKKFKFNFSLFNRATGPGPENYSAVDDGQTLSSWCASLDKPCCTGNLACVDWSSERDTTYEVCENSCVGKSRNCYRVAKKSANYSTIKFEAGSCSSKPTDNSGGGSSCEGMAESTKKRVNIRIGEGSCTNRLGCSEMARYATNLESIVVARNSCTNLQSCYQVARDAQFLTLISIDENQCTSEEGCLECGKDSTFSEALQLTQQCCPGPSFGSNFGTACQYSEPSASPSISSIPSTSNQPSSMPSNHPSSRPSLSSIPSKQPSNIPSSEPSEQPSYVPSDVPSDIPSDIPSDVPSDQPSLFPSSIPSDLPSDIPSDVPSDQPSSLPSSMPSDIPSDVPSDQPSLLPSPMPSDIPSDVPSMLPTSEPTWVDDEQCKKKDFENDICEELDGRCKIDCEDDENFVCVPGLCSYDRNWDKPTKSPKMRQLMNKDVEMVDIEITATGNAERKLKSIKAPSEKETKNPKATKAPKSSCACRVPRRNRCN